MQKDMKYSWNENFNLLHYVKWDRIVTLTGAQADWGLRYLVSNPVPSSGKAADAPIEGFTNGLYLESAKINSFRKV
jgi:hypothetical protein